MAAATTGAITGQGGGTYTGAMPGSSTMPSYQAQQLSAYQNALLQLNMQRQGIAQQSGLQIGVDPNSGASTIGGWLGDPTSGYGQTLQALDQNNQAQNASQAASGFMSGSGISKQAGEAAQRLASGTMTGFLGGVQSGLSGIDQGVLQAGTDYYTGLPAATLQSIQTAIANGSFNPANVGTLGASYGSSAPTVTKAPKAGTTKGIFDGFRPPKLTTRRHR